jgi:transposase
VVPADHRSHEELAAENAQLREMVAELRAEIAELKRRLGQTSRNSSTRPSSDSPFAKPAPRSLRRKGGRKPGGQQGHPGSTLAQVAEPDERVRHEPGPCAGCGADLADAPEVTMERRQVFDLPPLRDAVKQSHLRGAPFDQGYVDLQQVISSELRGHFPGHDTDPPSTIVGG